MSPTITSAPEYEPPDCSEQTLTKAYLSVLTDGAANEAGLRRDGVPAEAVRPALRALEARGLIERRTDGRWSPLTPDLTLHLLAAGLHSRARAWRALSPGMEPSPPDVAGEATIRVLASSEQVHDASAALMDGATIRVRSLVVPSAQVRRMFASSQGAVQLLRPTSSGHVVSRETVYDTAVLDLPGAGEALAARGADGERHGFHRAVPFGVSVVDGRAAVVDLSGIELSGRGSLLVHDPTLVAALDALVDSFWRQSLPLPQVGEDADLDERDRQVVTLLAGGAADVSIARQLGISQRTVERRVRTLMTMLGAGTRFQAGALAARRGWI